MAFQEFSASMQTKENSSNWTSTPLRRNNNNNSKCKINISGKILSFQRGCSLNFKLLVMWHRGFECACGYSSLLCVAPGTNGPSRKESVYSCLDLESDPSDGVVLNPMNIPALNHQFTTGCSCSCDQVLPVPANSTAPQMHGWKSKGNFQHHHMSDVSTLAASQEFLCVYNFIKESKFIKYYLDIQKGWRVGKFFFSL